MARKFLVPIDLNGLELQNARMQNLGSAPGSPSAGLAYFNTAGAVNVPTMYNGSAWKTLAYTDSAISSTTYVGTTAIALNRASASQALTGITSIDGTAAGLSAVLGPALGGTGVANNAANTITFTGNYALAITLTAGTNVTFPTSGTLANTAYVDNAVAGLSWKEEVRVATTAAGTLASSFANGQTVDGVTLVTGDRILIKDQAAGAENGIYTVNSSGAPTRATDADTAADIAGAAVCVMFGTTNAGVRFILSTSGTITLGTTALSFAVFGGGTSYTAGNGLQLATTTFSVKLPGSSGLVADGTGLHLDTAIAVRKFTQATHASTTSIAVTHNLGTRNVTTCVYDNSTYAEVECDVVHTDANTVTFTFATAPSANAYSFVIHG